MGENTTFTCDIQEPASRESQNNTDGSVRVAWESLAGILWRTEASGWFQTRACGKELPHFPIASFHVCLRVVAVLVNSDVDLGRVCHFHGDVKEIDSRDNFGVSPCSHVVFACVWRFWLVLRMARWFEMQKCEEIIETLKCRLCSNFSDRNCIFMSFLRIRICQKFGICKQNHIFSTVPSLRSRSRAMGSEAQEAVLASFRKFDADSSGAISREELGQVLKAPDF